MQSPSLRQIVLFFELLSWHLLSNKYELKKIELRLKALLSRYRKFNSFESNYLRILVCRHGVNIKIN